MGVMETFIVCSKISMVHLEPYQTTVMKRFCKNSSQLLAVNYFRKKLGLKISDSVLNTPLRPVKTFLKPTINTLEKRLVSPI